MDILLDASALVDLFLVSVNSQRIVRFTRSNQVRLHVSDFATGEFASAVKRERGPRKFSDQDVRDIFSAFDEWRAANVKAVATDAADVRVAGVFMRRLDINLRMPDAVYIAAAQRLGLLLCSFDARQLAAARALGVDVVDIP